MEEVTEVIRLINKPFNYRKAREITTKFANGEKVNAKIVDKFGVYYDYVSKNDRKENKIYARKEGQTGYWLFRLNGKALDGENELYIEEEFDVSEYKMIISQYGDIAYCKLSNVHEYLVVSLNGNFRPYVGGISENMLYDSVVKYHFHNVNEEEKDKIYSCLYNTDTYYDCVNMKWGKLVKHLKVGEIYAYYDTLFSVSEEYDHDMRNPFSIPYRFLYDMKNDCCYKDSTLGLPKNVGIREATEDEVILFGCKYMEEYEGAPNLDEWKEKKNEYLDYTRGYEKHLIDFIEENPQFLKPICEHFELVHFK